MEATAKTKKLKEVLLRAADILERGHLAKEIYALDKDGYEVDARSKNACSFCTEGAIQAASGSSVEAREAVQFFASNSEEIKRAAEDVEYDGTPSRYTVHHWNDRPSRRKGQVVAALRKAAR